MIKLNLGCGTDYKLNYINIDIVKRRETKLNFLKHDLNKPLPFKDNSVDEIFSSHFLEHIKNLDLLMNECYRVLKPNGIFICVVPHFTSINNYYEFHVRSCRYDFLKDYYIDNDDNLVNAKFYLYKRSLEFKYPYTFMNIINKSEKLIRIWEGTFLRNVFFCSQLRITLFCEK